MGIQSKTLAVTGLLSWTLADTAQAFKWGPPVPEFDGSLSLAVFALLFCVGAILFRGSRSR